MDEELAEKIYNVMKEHFGGSDVQHQVAKDFSRSELARFMYVYTDYFMK